MLKRNTTRVETGIPLRDSLVGYMQNFCTCDDVLLGKQDSAHNVVGKNGQPCGNRDPNDRTKWLVDPLEVSFCQQAAAFRDNVAAVRDGCSCAQAFKGDTTACPANLSIEERVANCVADLADNRGPQVGTCSCLEAMSHNPACGNVTLSRLNFCENPTAIPIALGIEDNRISRRVK